MFAPRFSLLTPAILSFLMISGNAGIAGPIAAGSVSGGPPLLDSMTPGSNVRRSNLIVSQYNSVGLDSTIFSNLSLPGLGSIGGTTAFVPTTSTLQGFNLDFDGFVGFQLVNPNSHAAATTNHLTVEFVGPRARFGYLYAMDPAGGFLGAAHADGGIGPHGGFLATLNVNGIGIFSAWSILNSDLKIAISSDPTWGLAMVDISGEGIPNDPPPGGGTSETPEPATLGLACAGLLGTLGAAWKRKRNGAG
jgi:hypothetical protein